MSKIRKQDDKPAALDHALYEMLMLVQAVVVLTRGNLHPNERSGWVEVFAIHARNLNEFFSDAKLGRSYMKVHHFVPEWKYSYDFDGGLAGRASSQVAHLTYNRERPEEKTGWPVETIFKALRSQSLLFLDAIKGNDALMPYRDNRGRVTNLLCQRSLKTSQVRSLQNQPF